MGAAVLPVVLDYQQCQDPGLALVVQPSAFRNIEKGRTILCRESRNGVINQDKYSGSGRICYLLVYFPAYHCSLVVGTMLVVCFIGGVGIGGQDRLSITLS